MNTAIVVLIVIVALGYMMNSLNKTQQRARGRGRCVYCKSRLKVRNGEYASACRRCGQTMLWAE